MVEFDIKQEAYVLTLFASELRPEIDRGECYEIVLGHLSMYGGVSETDAKNLAKNFLLTIRKDETLQ